MQTIGVIVFVAVVLMFFSAVMSQFQEKNQEHNHKAMWVTMGIVLVLGILALLGVIKNH